MTPKEGMLYKLTTDLNTPDYYFLKNGFSGPGNEIKSCDNLFDFLIPRWYRLKQDEILLFVKKGQKVESAEEKKNITAVRILRKYAFWSAEKFEYYFIWKDKFIMAVLCEQDWGKILIPAENE